MSTCPHGLRKTPASDSFSVDSGPLIKQHPVFAAPAEGRTLNYCGFNGPTCPLGAPEGLIEGPVPEHLLLMKVRTGSEPLAGHRYGLAVLA